MNYYSIFKSNNIEIDGNEFKLNKNIRLYHTNEYFIEESELLTLTSLNNQHFSYSLIETLNESKVVFEEITTADEHENRPFDCDSNSKFAIAISILKNERFEAGVSFFFNDRDGKELGARSINLSVIKGENRKLSLYQSEKDKLKNIYDFVLKGLNVSGRDETIFRLILLYTRVIIFTENSRSEILKSDFGGIYNQGNSSILNAAIFFECVLTKESKDFTRGVEHWNKAFVSSKIDLEDIRIIMNYRHSVFHNNATKALGIIQDYKKTKNLNDLDFERLMNEKSLSISRFLLRTIAFEYSNYLSFLATLPSGV